MEREQVESSHVVAIGYDKKSETLEVEFTNGMIYQYFDVPKKNHKKLMKASCIDGYLNTEIKNVYPYKSIT